MQYVFHVEQYQSLKNLIITNSETKINRFAKTQQLSSYKSLDVSNFTTSFKLLNDKFIIKTKS